MVKIRNARAVIAAMIANRYLLVQKGIIGITKGGWNSIEDILNTIINSGSR